MKTTFEPATCAFGEAGVADGNVRLLSGWFCPYAQQVRIAFRHRQLQHTVVEAMRWPNNDPQKSNQPYEKSAELLQHSSAGLVPTVVSSDGRHSVSEMIPAIELGDELPAPGPQLLPGDPWERARARTTAEWLQRKVGGGFFEVLVPGEHM